MKKLLFGLIATVMLSNLSFGQNQLNISDYGKLHNICIESYYKKYGTDIKDTNIKEMLNNQLLIMQAQYPEQFKNLDINDLYNYFAPFNSVKDFNLSVMWGNYKSKIMKKGDIPIGIIDLMDDLTKNTYDYDTVVLKVQTLKKDPSLNDTDIKRLNIFLNVLESSNQLWNSKTGKRDVPCRYSTIICDAGGSLMFFYCGPLSIVCGACCSLCDAANC